MGQFATMIVGATAGVMNATIQNAQNAATYTAQTAQTDAANVLSEDQADNSNSIRESNNSFLATQAALSNAQRSITNQNKAIAIGQQTDALAVNQSRAMEAMTRGNVEQQLSAAAQLGALRVESAAKGVGGTSADIMRSTMQGTTARLTTMQAQKGSQMTFDQVMQMSGMRSNLITSQDYGQTVAAMDYAKAIPQTFIAPMRMPDVSMAQAALLGAAGQGLGQFSQSNGGSGTTVGSTGGVGSTQNYASQSIMSGVNSIGSWGSDAGNSSYSGGGNSYGFSMGDSGSSSSGGMNNSFNFSLS
ncbi:hypothetical protein ACFPTO_01840 [Paraburkholderia denitrificans]|uniref:Internal virion protein n=1 Tax=Paraburkholderia denitrificans TaxID=694025 RepID=A0ABW0J3G4_9BURK